MTVLLEYKIKEKRLDITLRGDIKERISLSANSINEILVPQVEHIDIIKLINIWTTHLYATFSIIDIPTSDDIKLLRSDSKFKNILQKLNHDFLRHYNCIVQ